MRQVQEDVVDVGLLVEEAVREEEDGVERVVPAEGRQEEEAGLARRQAGEERRDRADAVRDVVDLAQLEQAEEQALAVGLDPDELRDVADHDDQREPDGEGERQLPDHVTSRVAVETS